MVIEPSHYFVRVCVAFKYHIAKLYTWLTSSSAFPLFGVGASSFHSPCCPVLRVVCRALLSHSCRPVCVTSLHLSFGLPIFQFPLSSIFHVLITTSSSVFLSTWPNNLSLASRIFSLMFATPALGLIFLRA